VRTREAAASVLGEYSVETEVSPIGAPTGVGVSVVDGELVRFRSPFVPDAAVRRHVERHEGLVADPVDLLSQSLMAISERQVTP
jgi:S-DNA-T family DNA segregation ATPase FtsK/SpoIIIE